MLVVLQIIYVGIDSFVSKEVPKAESKEIRTTIQIIVYRMCPMTNNRFIFILCMCVATKAQIHSPSVWPNMKMFICIWFHVERKGAHLSDFMVECVNTWTHTNIKDYNKHVPNCCCCLLACLLQRCKRIGEEVKRRRCEIDEERKDIYMPNSIVARTEQKNYHKRFHK